MVRPPVIRPAKVVRLDKVVAVSQTQALDCDYTVTFSAQRLSQVVPSDRALHYFQCYDVCTSTLQVWVAVTGHNFCTKVYEVEAVERS